jgi:spore germination protein KC
MHKETGIRILIILLSLLLSGCWDRRDPEDLLLVNSILFDRIESGNNMQYKVSFTASKPGFGGVQTETGGGDSGQQGSKRWIATCYGNTLEETLSKLSRYSTRSTYLGHTRIIAFSEGLIRRGIYETIDFLVRKQNIRFRSYVVITKEKDVLLSSEARYEETLTEELASILRLGSLESDYFYSIDLNRFIQDLLTEGQDPWAPVIKFPSTSAREEIAGRPSIMVEGTAMFQGDRLAGFLSAEETQGFLMLSGLAQKGSISVRSEGKILSFKYDEVNSKRKLILSDGKPKIEYQISCKGNLEEINLGTILSEETITQLEEMFSNKIKHNLIMTLQKCQQMKSDILGIGRFIHAANPRVWREYRQDWTNIFPEIEILTTVDTEIVGTDFGFIPVGSSNKGR